MESLEIDDSLRNLKKENGNYQVKDINEYNINTPDQNSLLPLKKEKNCKYNKLLNIPFSLYILILIILLCIITFLTYISYIFVFEVKYIYEEKAYIKPKYSSQEYSTVTFDNGLKLVLVQTNSDDKAGGVISFDYGYLDTNFEPGYLRLAFLSLINNNISNSFYLSQYFGQFNYAVEKYYTSFDFNILGGGFQSYLKHFATLTYLKDDDERLKFEQISKKSFDTSNSLVERKNHILEYLVYGYKDSEGRDIIPKDSSQIIRNLNGDYTPIINIMKKILSDPTKIKIILYSHYKTSWMKKYFLKYFNDIINIPKINNNDINNVNNNINSYNLYNFTTNQIIYMNLFGSEQNFLEINYFLTKDDNTKYNELIRDSQYLIYITYILNQTNEGSLYYELNNDKNNISIKSLSSGYEVILKNKIKFSILVEFNHYSYNFIPEIINKVYNYINKIKLFINDYNDTFKDIRVDELEIISEQNFTYTEDAHDNNYYKYISQELFYKDDKDFLLKQMWFKKDDFIKNIDKVKYYYNQLTMNNSVIIIGITSKIRNNYKLRDSNISYIFQKTSRTRYFPFTYSTNILSEHFKENYDNNYTILLNPEENEFISKYNSSCELDFDPDDYENYFEKPFEEVNNIKDDYTKTFWKKDTSLHIPKIYSKTFFFHPFFRPNWKNETNNDIYNHTKNHKFIFEYLLYFAYINREIKEKLADCFRAGGNYFLIYYNENFIFIDLFLFSDIAKKVFNIVKDIIYNETDFIKKLENRFEIYRDFVLEELLNSNYYTDNMKLKYTFFGAITNDKNKNEDSKNKYKNLPPIYDITKFPYDSFVNITYNEINKDKDLKLDIYSIKYIFLFGYYDKSDALDIYKIFNTNISNNFEIPLDIANFNFSEINDTNFVDWVLEKPIIKSNQNIICNTNNKAINRFIFFTEFNLKDSCLSQMLKDILNEEKNMRQNDISVNLLNQKYIYIRFTFYNKTIENNDFRNDLITWLGSYEEMENQIDVIGDRFYYLLKGYKTETTLKHYNIYDSAFSSIYGKLYNTVRNNNDLKFEMKTYRDFIEYIKGFFNKNKNYVEIEPST